MILVGWPSINAKSLIREQAIGNSADWCQLSFMGKAPCIDASRGEARGDWTHRGHS